MKEKFGWSPSDHVEDEKNELESLLWMLKEYVQAWREASKEGNRTYQGKWVYEDCAQEIEDLVKEHEGG